MLSSFSLSLSLSLRLGRCRPKSHNVRQRRFAVPLISLPFHWNLRFPLLLHRSFLPSPSETRPAQSFTHCRAAIGDMADSMFLEDGPRGGTRNPFLRSASVKDVSYSCGSCGYELNLSSLNRNVSTIGAKYSKSIKKGIISFCNVDESRFTLVDELQCIPYFTKQSWGLFRRRAKLLCCKCGKHIGIAYDPITSSDPLVSDGLESFSSSEVPSHRKYDIRIRALQPSSSEESSMSLFV